MFDKESSTYTYLIADEKSQEAVLIDPVATYIEQYIVMLDEQKLTLKYALETHVHADHITAGGLLREQLSVKTGVSELCGATTADIQLNDGDVITIGNQKISVIATPGHTAGSVSFLYNDRVFTGDTLLINGCGRTDFQGGSAEMLFDSISKKLFTLPEDTLVYPGHDYNGRRVSSIAQEKSINPRLASKTKEEFIVMMNGLDLPMPRLIDIAVPANRKCGLPEPEVLQG
jgi:glyoxylase-like metal-dependent hydrolase (beta-lactamase superfamily II)